MKILPLLCLAFLLPGCSWLSSHPDVEQNGLKVEECVVGVVSRDVLLGMPADSVVGDAVASCAGATISLVASVLEKRRAVPEVSMAARRMLAKPDAGQ